MKKELIILSVLMVIAIFVISGCSNGEAIKGIRKDAALKTTEPIKTVRNQSFCNDTDSGIEPFVQGTVFTLNGNYNDDCKNNHAVTEYYCNGTEAKSTYIDCEDLYPNGICQEGICINDSNNNQSNATCIDSDGGINYYVRGTTTGVYLYLQNQGILPSYDTCVGNFGNLPNGLEIGINEFYCENNFKIDTMYECPNGCLNGTCINNGTTPHNVSVMNNTINATR
jgi:hypothetical protein